MCIERSAFCHIFRILALILCVWPRGKLSSWCLVSSVLWSFCWRCSPARGVRVVVAFEHGVRIFRSHLGFFVVLFRCQLWLIDLHQKTVSVLLLASGCMQMLSWLRSSLCCYFSENQLCNVFTLLFVVSCVANAFSTFFAWSGVYACAHCVPKKCGSKSSPVIVASTDGLLSSMLQSCGAPLRLPRTRSHPCRCRRPCCCHRPSASSRSSCAWVAVSVWTSRARCCMSLSLFVMRGSCYGHCLLKPDWTLGSGRPRLLYTVDHVAEHLVESRRRHPALDLAVTAIHALRILMLQATSVR